MLIWQRGKEVCLFVASNSFCNNFSTPGATKKVTIPWMPSPNLDILEADLMPPDPQGFPSVIAPAEHTYSQSVLAWLAENSPDWQHASSCFLIGNLFSSVSCKRCLKAEAALEGSNLQQTLLAPVVTFSPVPVFTIQKLQALSPRGCEVVNSRGEKCQGAECQLGSEELSSQHFSNFLPQEEAI